MVFLITKELIFGFQILDLKDHFSASLKKVSSMNNLFGKIMKHIKMPFLRPDDIKLTKIYKIKTRRFNMWNHQQQ